MLAMVSSSNDAERDTSSEPPTDNAPKGLFSLWGRKATASVAFLKPAVRTSLTNPRAFPANDYFKVQLYKAR